MCIHKAHFPSCHARHSCSVFPELWCGCSFIKLAFYLQHTQTLNKPPLLEKTWNFFIVMQSPSIISVDYNGRSSDICRAIAVYDHSLRYRLDGLAGQRVRTYTHTCTLARLGLGAMSGVVWNGTRSLTTRMRWQRNDRLVLPPLPLKIRRRKRRGRFLCLPIRSGRLTTSRSIRRFLGCGVMSTNVINHLLDCCGVLSVGDSRRE